MPAQTSFVSQSFLSLIPPSIVYSSAAALSPSSHSLVAILLRDLNLSLPAPLSIASGVEIVEELLGSCHEIELAGSPNLRTARSGTTEDEEFRTTQKPTKKCGMSDAASSNGCFDCNICLDFAADPVVTLCGHLYCWPCIYRWLQQGPGDSPQQCPVCKAVLLQQTLVPLYGRGQSTATPEQQSIDIPRRPTFEWEGTQRRLIQSREEERNLAGSPPPHQHHVLDYPPIVNSIPSPTLGTSWLMHSTSGEVLRGITVAVLPSMFRDQERARVYYSAGIGGSPRVRRLEFEVGRSLHHIWVFLFCCVILCLLLF